MPAKIMLDGHAFNNENEYRRYCGLVQLLKEGRINSLEVNPEYELLVKDELIAKYSPTFKFIDTTKNTYRYIQIMPRLRAPVLEMKIRLFEILYKIVIERWG